LLFWSLTVHVGRQHRSCLDLQLHSKPCQIDLQKADSRSRGVIKIVEQLLSKCEALSSIPSTTKDLKKLPTFFDFHLSLLLPQKANSRISPDKMFMCWWMKAPRVIPSSEGHLHLQLWPRSYHTTSGKFFFIFIHQQRFSNTLCDFFLSPLAV
jgi:hypothetical protein